MSKRPTSYNSQAFQATSDSAKGENNLPILLSPDTQRSVPGRWGDGGTCSGSRLERPLLPPGTHNDTRQKRREQTEVGHYRPLSSHALCHIRNCSHRVNPARSTARLNGVKKDTKKRKHRAIKALHRPPPPHKCSSSSKRHWQSSGQRDKRDKRAILAAPGQQQCSRTTPLRGRGRTRGAEGHTCKDWAPMHRVTGGSPRKRGRRSACGSGRRRRSANAALPELKNTHSVPRGKRRRRKKTQGL